MHSMKVKLKGLVEKISNHHGKRLSALALTVAILAGTLLAFPAIAEETVVVETTTSPAHVSVSTIKMLEMNLEAIKAATVKANETYAGEILPLHNVILQVDDTESVLCLQAGTTVLEAIAAADVTLGEADELTVEGDRYITDGLTVGITRVAFRDYEKTFSVDYKTEIQYSSELRQGTSKVTQKGKEGVRTITYRERLEDGKVISTTEIKNEITTQPVNKIIVKGTKVSNVVSEAPWDIQLDDKAQPINYKKVLSGKCTAYTTDRGDSGAWTATGKRAQVGIVAVDPNDIPYGTKLWIVSADGKTVYGYAIAGDTGGAAKSGKIIADLFFDTYGECEKFGRRTMNVYILG